MPYNTTAIPPRKEPTGQTQLPLARVRKIIGADPDVALCSSNAAFVITLATEIFVQYLTSEAQTMVKLDRKPRRNLQYRDVANAVRRIDRLEFLEDTVPSTVPFGKIKHDAAAAQAQLRGTNGSDGATTAGTAAVGGGGAAAATAAAGSSAGGGGGPSAAGTAAGNSTGRSSSKTHRSSAGGGSIGSIGSTSARPTTISALTDGVIDSTAAAAGAGAGSGAGKKRQQVLPFSILNKDDDSSGDVTNDEAAGSGVAAAAALAQAAAASGAADGRRRSQAHPHLHAYDDDSRGGAAPYTYDKMALDTSGGGAAGSSGYGPDAQLHLEEQGMPVGVENRHPGGDVPMSDG